MPRRRTTRCLLATVAAVWLTWGGTVICRAGSVQRPCDPRIEICSRPTPTPRVRTTPTPAPTPRPRPHSHAPRLDPREPKAGVLKFDQLTAGKIDPKDKTGTGVRRQPNKKFTLFNEYSLKAVKSDLFVIQLEADREAPSAVQISILDKEGKEVLLKPVSVRPGEVELKTPGGQLPGDGTYRVLVRCPDLNVKSPAVSYRIIAAKLTPIAAGKVEEGSVSRQGSRWVAPATASKNTLFNEHVLTVENSDPLVLRLQAAQPQPFKVSVSEWESRVEINSGQADEQGCELRFNAPGAAQLKQGKYRLQVQHATPAGAAAAPYSLLLTRFAPVAIGSEVKGRLPQNFSKATPAAARGVDIHWDDYPLSVARTEILTIHLQPNDFAAQVLDEKGRVIPLTPRDTQTGEIDLATADGTLQAEGKYYLRVLLNSAPAAPAAYTLRLSRARLSAEVYQAEVQRVWGEFERAKNFEYAVKRLQRLIRSNPEEPRAFEALGRIYLEQQNFAAARRNIEMSLRLGGAFSFEVLHNEKWGDIEITSKGELKWKNRSQSSFRLQRGRLELNSPGKPTAVLTGQSIEKVALITATSKVFIEEGGPRGKRLHFMPLSMKQSESELIVGLIQSNVGGEGR